MASLTDEDKNDVDNEDEHGDDGADEQLADDFEELSGLFVQAEIYLEVDSEEEPSGFFATVNDNDNMTAYVATIRNAAAYHALNGQTNIYFSYEEDFFYGVMIGAGCACASTGGLSQ